MYLYFVSPGFWVRYCSQSRRCGSRRVQREPHASEVVGCLSSTVESEWAISIASFVPRRLRVTTVTSSCARCPRCVDWTLTACLCIAPSPPRNVSESPLELLDSARRVARISFRRRQNLKGPNQRLSGSTLEIRAASHHCTCNTLALLCLCPPIR